MKKIFTLLSGLLFATGFAAQAEEVTVYVSDYDGNDVAKSFTTELTKDADGNYVLADLLNSGCPLTFNFKQPAIGESSEMEFPNLEFDKDGSAYFMTPEGKYATCYLEEYNGEELYKVKWPYIWGGEYSYVYANEETEDYAYYANICLGGFDSDSEYLKDDLYLVFYFNEIKAEEGDQSGNESDEIEAITIDILDYDDEEIADSYTTTLTKDANGNYVIGDFLNSGTPIVFNFEEPASVDEYTNITFPELTLDKEGSAYILTADGKYATAYMFGFNNEEVTKVKWPYVYGNGYSTVLRLDEATYGYPYYASIEFSGFDEDGNWLPDTYFLTFYFNGLKDSEGDQSGVVSVEEVENAPVEYYNLNGQRVANPSNGIFIRKQGSKTSKVVIR